jgi:hypothetical protein
MTEKLERWSHIVTIVAFPLLVISTLVVLYQIIEVWPAPGSEDTELGVLMEPEVGHGEAEVYT